MHKNLFKIITISILATLLFAGLSEISFAKDTARAEKLYKKGDALLTKGKLEEARKTLEAAIKADSSHYDSYLSLGITFAELKDLKKAYETFSKAIAVIPDESVAYINRGEISALKEDFDSACKDWLKACNLDDCMRYDIEVLKNRCFPKYHEEEK
jgi:tetratricopeptide (TPR) repeat protein